MADSIKILHILISLCLVSLVVSAAVEYQEPVLEASTDDDEGNEIVEEVEETTVAETDDVESEDKTTETNEEADQTSNEVNGEPKEGTTEEAGMLKEASGDSMEKDETSTTEEPEKSEKEIKEESDGKVMKKLGSVVEDEMDTMEEGESVSGEEETVCPANIKTIESVIGKIDEGEGCKLSAALSSMVDVMIGLKREVKALKTQVESKCSGKADDSSEEEDKESSGDGYRVEGSGDDQPMQVKCEEPTSKEDDKADELIATTEEATTVPPPPTSCPSPYQLIADSCYYIQTDTRETRSWGNANAFCQQLMSGSLASPYEPEKLRNYLKDHYSSSFWIGARKTDSTWQWISGRAMKDEDWRQGKPDKNPSKQCAFIESWHSYKASNNFCGEKFPFVCEHRAT